MRSVLFVAGLMAAVVPGLLRAAPQSDLPVGDTRRAVHDYAICVVKRRASEASEALLSDIDNVTLMKRYHSLIDGDCLTRSLHASVKMSFPGDLYRYALADALFARELANYTLPDLSDVPPLERRALPDAPKPPAANASKSEKSRYQDDLDHYVQAEAFRAVGEYGECVVRKNPSAAKALLLTNPETPAETSSFNALRPALGECLPEGRTFAFGKLVLRGTIAVNYYRLAHAAGAVPVR